MSCQRIFSTPTSGVHFPRQVSFAENGKVVVGGSREGVIYVFDLKSGAILDLLHHSDGKVLAVTARNLSFTSNHVITFPRHSTVVRNTTSRPRHQSRSLRQCLYGRTTFRGKSEVGARAGSSLTVHLQPFWN